MRSEGKVNILLVDDQPNNLFALEAILEGEDRNLVRAGSGEEALMRILDNDFAVILMDVQMPGMDGFETAALIRERDRSKHTPIIFLTAFESSDVQVFKGYSLGAVDYLSKPIVPGVLRSKVGVFVDLFQKTEQVRRQSELLVENQRKEHERELAEEKRRWEIERLREETARERKVSEALTLRAHELAETIAERVRAEEQLRRRVRQQAIVADLGQRALEGIGLATLLDEAVGAVTQNLEVEFGRIMELAPDSGTLWLRAGIGWDGAAGGEVEATDEPGSFASFRLARSEPIVVEDLRNEGRFALTAFLERHGVISGVSVNIHGRDRPFGTLEAFSRGSRTFSHDDATFLQAVAHVLATAIQRKRDDEELSKIKDELAVQLADMTRLHALSVRLSNSLELQTVMEQVLEAVTSLQGTERGVLMLYDRDRDVMSTAASVGFGGEPLELDERMAPGYKEGGTVSAIISGGIIVQDLGSDPIFAPHLAAALRSGCRAVCSTPLLTVGGELVGTIATYFDRPHRPSDRETRLVELYGRQAAEFIENARLYRQIREADRRKGEFLAMLAHELRNPLAPILNALHYLGTGSTDAEAVEQARAIAERQVRHLARLVDDLLDVSRINSGKVQLRLGDVDLASSIERAVETSRPLIEARCHELTVSLPEESVGVVGDAARLEQVLSNLLNNAAKYTDGGGHVRLAAEVVGPEVVLSVEDDVIGIAPELSPHLFEMFSQATPALERSHGGLGLGLALVRGLVEMHGGTVEARSDGPGRGSAFTVRLRAAPAPAIQSPRPAADATSRAGLRIVVADDNEDAAYSLGKLLRLRGNEVCIAHDGREAVERAAEFRPDLVVLDIGMPRLNGYEAARLIREQPWGRDLALVALTGWGQEDDKRQAREAGFDAHLTKPVDPEELAGLLGSVVPRKCD